MKREEALNEHRFECQCCGYCCLEKAIIYPSYEEIKLLADYMNISVPAFAIRYLREIYNPQTDLYAVAFKTGLYGDGKFGCIFNHNKLCMIYDSPRTDLCNVFPWNHFNTETNKWDDNFVSINGEFWCPGIGKGREWTLDKIISIKNAYPNFGDKIEIYYNKPSIISNESISNLTISEEKIIDKFRELSLEKKIEFEQLLNNLYNHI